MTRVVSIAACSALLAGPTVLAFFSGGYFDEPRLVGALAAWALAGAAAVATARPLPRSGSGRLALGGAAALAALTVASIAWAPLAGPALDDAQRALLYLGALVAAAAFLPACRAFLEPALAGGALAVVSYGFSERFLPGLFDLRESATAGGRLEQPLTYWNAMGALAAMGLVLAARLAGDERRPAWLRAGAAAAAAPLGAGVYLTFSRGAIAALAAGLVVLAGLAPRRAQLRALALSVATGAIAALCCGLLPWVRSLEQSGPAPGLQGLLALGAVATLAALAAWVTLRWTRQGAAEPRSAPRLGLAGTAAAVALVGAVLLTAAIEGRPEAGSPADGARTERLRSLDSTRYDYWRVALDTFASHPLAGTGAGGFRVEWLRERDEPDASRDAHSLYLETLAELGLAGLAALLAFVGGLGLCARRAFRADPAALAGPIALVATWLVHGALDWDWEMPAVTLPAIVAAGAIVAAADRAPGLSPRAG
jgi:O-Antigen ligase